MNVLQEEDKTRLCLDGELTVQDAESFKQGLLQALGQSEEVEIDLEKVTTVDLAGLQLLCAAHRTAQEEGKSLVLSIGSVPVLEQARRTAGFVLSRSCRHAPSSDCFWVGGMER